MCNVKGKEKKEEKRNKFFSSPKINFNDAMSYSYTVAYRIACKTSSRIDKEACYITQKKKYFDFDQ